MAADARPLDEIRDPRFDPKFNILQRISLGMTLADYLQKEKKQGMKYSIISHDAVTAAIRDVCLKCGIVYWPLGGSEKIEVNGNRAELSLHVRFANIDKPDDYIDVIGFGFGIDPGDKGPGKAMSYAVKYALLKAFGLETGDDPDQDQDVQHRTGTMQRADELEKQLLNTQSKAVFRQIMLEDSTKQIFASLAAQNLAERRRLGAVVSQHAEKLGVDLKTLDADAKGENEETSE